MWWKVFSAALAAGLIVFAVFRIDRQMDKDAAQWDETASDVIRGLKASLETWDPTTPPTSRPRYGGISPDEYIKDAESHLAEAPMRAKSTLDLKREIERAKSRIAEPRK